MGTMASVLLFGMVVFCCSKFKIVTSDGARNNTLAHTYAIVSRVKFNNLLTLRLVMSESAHE